MGQISRGRSLRQIFCAPGRDETFEDAFGALTWPDDIEIGSVDFDQEFAQLRFSDKVDFFRREIEDHYWSKGAMLLGRSFGGWILLNTLVGFDAAYPGTVILISSVLGYGSAEGLQFIAPNADGFWREVERSAGPPSDRMLLLHSTDDQQCSISYAERLAKAWSIELIAFEDGGHDLGKIHHLDEVSRLIQEKWL